MSETSVASLLTQLSDLYASMDAAYAAASARHGFHCTGCAENCCEERLFHYTLIEQAYLASGLVMSDRAVRQEIWDRAAVAVKTHGALDKNSFYTRVLCPLSFEGRCRLYAHRPMICRLHGIPHRLRQGSGRERVFPGCHVFSERRSDGGADEVSLDRTELYVRMAGIERRMRETVGFAGKIKKSVAEMILDGAGQDDR